MKELQDKLKELEQTRSELEQVIAQYEENINTARLNIHRVEGAIVTLQQLLEKPEEPKTKSKARSSNKTTKKKEEG